MYVIHTIFVNISTSTKSSPAAFKPNHQSQVTFCYFTTTWIFSTNQNQQMTSSTSRRESSVCTRVRHIYYASVCPYHQMQTRITTTTFCFLQHWMFQHVYDFWSTSIDIKSVSAHPICTSNIHCRYWEHRSSCIFRHHPNQSTIITVTGIAQWLLLQ